MFLTPPLSLNKVLSLKNTQATEKYKKNPDNFGEKLIYLLFLYPTFNLLSKKMKSLVLQRKSFVLSKQSIDCYGAGYEKLKVHCVDNKESQISIHMFAA